MVVLKRFNEEVLEEGLALLLRKKASLRNGVFVISVPLQLNPKISESQRQSEGLRYDFVYGLDVENVLDLVVASFEEEFEDQLVFSPRPCEDVNQEYVRIYYDNKIPFQTLDEKIDQITCLGYDPQVRSLEQAGQTVHIYNDLGMSLEKGSPIAGLFGKYPPLLILLYQQNQLEITNAQQNNTYWDGYPTFKEEPSKALRGILNLHSSSKK